MSIIIIKLIFAHLLLYSLPPCPHLRDLKAVLQAPLYFHLQLLPLAFPPLILPPSPQYYPLPCLLLSLLPFPHYLLLFFLTRPPLSYSHPSDCYPQNRQYSSLNLPLNLLSGNVWVRQDSRLLISSWVLLVLGLLVSTLLASPHLPLSCSGLLVCPLQTALCACFVSSKRTFNLPVLSSTQQLYYTVPLESSHFLQIELPH